MKLFSLFQLANEILKGDSVENASMESCYTIQRGIYLTYAFRTVEVSSPMTHCIVGLRFYRFSIMYPHLCYEGSLRAQLASRIAKLDYSL